MKSKFLPLVLVGLLAGVGARLVSAEDYTKAPGTKGTNYEAQLPADATRLKIGDKAPDFDLLGIDGKRYTLADFKAMSDDDLIADFRARSGTVYHPSCTARMGRDAATSVVDSRLRVHGIAGLRVIDAAAFPNLIAGNTNAPAIMIGEKAADMIQADAKRAA